MRRSAALLLIELTGGLSLLMVPLISAPLAAQQPGRELQTFTLQEVFGVSHPTQVIDFDSATRINRNSTYMVGPDGAEVPYQILSDGKIAVQTDLPANSERTFKLISGKGPKPLKGGVKVTKARTHYEITNELIGVRIPIPLPALNATPAPIQGIRYRDGTWTATGPNFLLPSAKTVRVTFIERGPLKVVVEVAYQFDRPDLTYGGKVLISGGEGYYRSRIEVQAGQPSILFEEDTDMDTSYSLNVYDGLHPTHARYRGHHSRAKEYGYEADGQQYRMWHERPAMDAFVDLKYDRPMWSNYASTADSWRRMAIWDPWVFDSGWYWQLFNAKAPAKSNLFGIFAGRASRAIGAANSGVGIFTAPLPDGKRAAGITVAANRRSPDGRVFPRVRFCWGMFLGIKGEDLKDPTEVQNIARQMNLHGGINLNKIHRYQLEFPDPPRGYGGLYMEKAILKAMIAKLRHDKGGPQGGGHYSYLYNAEPSSRELIDMWADAAGEKTSKAVEGIVGLARDLLNALVHGDGIYDFTHHYWHGGLNMMRKGVWIDQVLANESTAPQERSKVKAAAALFANILWDDDFVPLFREHGLNLGTENMPVQQHGYRDFYALLLAEHPTMRRRAQEVEERTLATLRHIINEHGAQIGSVHYIGASFAPTLNTLLQIRMLGKTEPLKTEERLSKFAEFYMNFLTPPEVRFGGVRKLIAVGDGSTESSEIYGQLATCLRDTDKELSARLMGAWIANGKRHSGFFGSTLLMIDEDAPAKEPLLSNATFPGWYSVLRYGWGTENETAVWFVNGDFYRDHRHADHGSVVIYALGAPLSIDWGSFYSPQVAGGFMHSMVLPEASVGHPWDKEDPPLNAGGYGIWGGSTQEAFLSFKDSAYARARFTAASGMVWRRSVYCIHPNETYPIIVVHDTFSGSNAEASKIFTLNLMAHGEVETPAGKMLPPLREPGEWNVHGATKKLPSAGQVFSLPPGVNHLWFKGQWLIDWDIYTVSDEVQQSHIGNWSHNWHPSPEQREFQRDNGRPFEESQHILRVKGNKAFKVLILPYRKGGERSDLQLTRDGSKVIITSKDETLIFDETFYAYRGPQKQVLATFSEAPAEANGTSAAGGAVEVAIEQQQVTVTAHGGKGLRRIKLPGYWKVKAPLRFANGEYTLDYAGGPPLQTILQSE